MTCLAINNELPENENLWFVYVYTKQKRHPN